MLLAPAFKIHRLVGSLAEAKSALSMRKQSEPTAAKCAPLHGVILLTNSKIARPCVSEQRCTAHHAPA